MCTSAYAPTYSAPNERSRAMPLPVWVTSRHRRGDCSTRQVLLCLPPKKCARQHERDTRGHAQEGDRSNRNQAAFWIRKCRKYWLLDDCEYRRIAHLSDTHLFELLRKARHDLLLKTDVALQALALQCELGRAVNCLFPCCQRWRASSATRNPAFASLSRPSTKRRSSDARLFRVSTLKRFRPSISFVAISNEACGERVVVETVTTPVVCAATLAVTAFRSARTVISRTTDGLSGFTLKNSGTLTWRAAVGAGLVVTGVVVLAG